MLPFVLLIQKENVISSINFSLDDISKKIQKLDPNKDYGHMISIRMLKICHNSVYKPKEIHIRMETLFLFIKKMYNQTLEYKSPVSLLPICGKALERLIFDRLFEFTENEFSSSNQFGFKPMDSCINQHLSITHEIYKSFDERYKV